MSINLLLLWLALQTTQKCSTAVKKWLRVCVFDMCGCVCKFVSSYPYLTKPLTIWIHYIPSTPTNSHSGCRWDEYSSMNIWWVSANHSSRNIGRIPNERPHGTLMRIMGLYCVIRVHVYIYIYIYIYISGTILVVLIQHTFRSSPQNVNPNSALLDSGHCEVIGESSTQLAPKCLFLEMVPLSHPIIII